MKHLILAALAVFLVFALPAAARGSQNFGLSVSSLDIAYYVEGQPGVTNPTPCLWDIDDRWEGGGYGNLEAGGSRQIAQCEIADRSHRLIGIYGHVPTPDLVVTLTYEPQGVSFTFSPLKRDRKTWEYGGCVTGPIYSTLALLPEIPDSNGGRGMLTTVTFSVKNPTARDVRGMSMQFLRGSDSPGTIRHSFCRGEQSSGFGMAGATWRTAL